MRQKSVYETRVYSQTVFELIDAGESISAIARVFDTTRQTIMRVRASRTNNEIVLKQN
ncbi:hypothetical protein PagCFBP13516_21420 [Pantoea agglomerans]|nr:hypothetical protein PagCFBP13516_21420 [Pantoea agglomerans]